MRIIAISVKVAVAKVSETASLLSRNIVDKAKIWQGKSHNLICNLRCSLVRSDTKRISQEEERQHNELLEELSQLCSNTKKTEAKQTIYEQTFINYLKNNLKVAAFELRTQQSRSRELPYIQKTDVQSFSLNEKNILLKHLTNLTNGLGFCEVREFSSQRSCVPTRKTYISIPTIESHIGPYDIIGACSFFMEEFPKRFANCNQHYNKLAFLELANERRKSFSEMHFMPRFEITKDIALERAKYCPQDTEKVLQQIKKINNDIKLYCLTSLLKLIFLMKNNLINNKSHIFYVHTNEKMFGFLTKLGFQKNSKLPENLDESIYSVQISRTELLDSEDKFKELALEYLKRHYSNTPI